MKTLELDIESQRFILHPSGAVFWKDQDLLLIADVHLGKVTHFRKNGSAVPQAAIQKNFTELQRLVDYFKPAEICFLGDLFHSYINSEWDLFEIWVKQLTSRVTLVTGNHDLISPHLFEALQIALFTERKISSFLLTHYPEERKGYFNLAGHIHPGIRLSGLGKQFLTVPCFYKNKYQLVLPAFGAFTGKHILSPVEGDTIFALSQDEVIRVAST